MDCPFVTGLKKMREYGKTSSKPEPNHGSCTIDFLPDPLLYRVRF